MCMNIIYKYINSIYYELYMSNLLSQTSAQPLHCEIGILVIIF